MVRPTWLLAVLIPLALLRLPLRETWPVLVGSATWYGEPAHLFITTKSGEPFDAEAMAFAVDIGFWEEMGGRDYWVCSYGKCVLARCWDTGHLAEVGVAVDLTPRAFRTLCGDLEMGRCSVRVYAK